MSLVLSDEQRLLREAAERFVATHYSLDQRRKYAEEAAGMSEPVWRHLAETGLLGIGLCPDGESTRPQADRNVVFEALGPALLIEPLLAVNVLAGTVLASIASSAEHRSLLAQLVAGESRVALAYAEPMSRYNLGAVSATARRCGDGYILDGSKCLVLGISHCEHVLVTVRTSGTALDREGVSLFLIPRASGDLSVRPSRLLDGTDAGELQLSGVKLGADSLVGQEGAALPVLERVVDYAAAAACAESVGALRHLVHLTEEHLRTRRQFGRPLAAFQALQHRMADMYLAQQRATAALALLRHHLDGDAFARSNSVSAAKVQIARSSRYVAQQAIQLHGAIAIAAECSVGLFVKRLMVIEALFGDITFHLRRYIDGAQRRSLLAGRDSVTVGVAR